MSKTSCFRGPFDKQYGKRAEPLFKSAWQHHYQIYWSLPSQLRWKKSLFFTCQILRLLANTLAADEKYPVLDRDNLTIPIQIQLSQKQKTFSQFLCAFLKSLLNFKNFEKKMTPRDFVFPKLLTPKMWSDEFLKSLVLADASKSNMLNVPKHWWNLRYSILIICTDHCQGNWIGKSLCLWQVKSCDCLLTYWLPMKSIVFLLETI